MMMNDLFLHECCDETKAYLLPPSITASYWSIEVLGGYAEIEIKYCPWCGEHLPEKVEGNS